MPGARRGRQRKDSLVPDRGRLREFNRSRRVVPGVAVGAHPVVGTALDAETKAFRVVKVDVARGAQGGKGRFRGHIDTPHGRPRQGVPGGVFRPRTHRRGGVHAPRHHLETVQGVCRQAGPRPVGGVRRKIAHGHLGLILARSVVPCAEGGFVGRIVVPDPGDAVRGDFHRKGVAGCGGRGQGTTPDFIEGHGGFFCREHHPAAREAHAAGIGVAVVVVIDGACAIGCGGVPLGEPEFVAHDFRTYGGEEEHPLHVPHVGEGRSGCAGIDVPHQKGALRGAVAAPEFGTGGAVVALKIQQCARRGEFGDAGVLDVRDGHRPLRGAVAAPKFVGERKVKNGVHHRKLAGTVVTLARDKVRDHRGSPGGAVAGPKLPAVDAVVCGEEEQSVCGAHALRSGALRAGPDVRYHCGAFGGAVAGPDFPAVDTVVGGEEHQVVCCGHALRSGALRAGPDVQDHRGAFGGAVAGPGFPAAGAVVGGEVEPAAKKRRMSGLASFLAGPDVSNQGCGALRAPAFPEFPAVRAVVCRKPQGAAVGQKLVRMAALHAGIDVPHQGCAFHGSVRRPEFVAALRAFRREKGAVVHGGETVRFPGCVAARNGSCLGAVALPEAFHSAAVHRTEVKCVAHRRQITGQA